MAILDAPFEVDLGKVPADWIDRNGHVNVTFYLVASERATTQLYEFLGLGKTLRAQSGSGMFCVEHHMSYMAEMRDGDPLNVKSFLLDCSEKGIHFLNRIYRGHESSPVAAVEYIELNVDLNSRRTVAFSPDVLLRLQDIQTAHAKAAGAAPISRTMSLTRG